MISSKFEWFHLICVLQTFPPFGKLSWYKPVNGLGSLKKDRIRSLSANLSTLNHPPAPLSVFSSLWREWSELSISWIPLPPGPRRSLLEEHEVSLSRHVCHSFHMAVWLSLFSCLMSSVSLSVRVICCFRSLPAHPSISLSVSVSLSEAFICLALKEIFLCANVRVCTLTWRALSHERPKRLHVSFPPSTPVPGPSRPPGLPARYSPGTRPDASVAHKYKQINREQQT